MTMKTLGNGHILGTLLGVFYLPSVVCYDWVTIPAALASAPARLAINSTSCSVTCGLGFKQEESCEVTPAGERKDCVMRTSRCLTRWFCGLLHFTIPVGKPFQLTCQPSDTADFDRQAYGYVWKFAQGLITTENVLFKRLQENDTVLRFSPTRESDGGTYRCDVRELKTFKLIKRVYFGVRVIRRDLVDLNFQKSLTWEQKLTAYGGEGNTVNITREVVQTEREFWQRQFFHEGLIGAAGGVAAGLVVIVPLCCLWKILRRRAAERKI